MTDYIQFSERSEQGQSKWLFDRLVELEKKYEEVKNDNVRLAAELEAKRQEENTCRIAELEIIEEHNNRISEVERKIGFIDTEYVGIGSRSGRDRACIYPIDTKRIYFDCSCKGKSDAGHLPGVRRCNGNPYKLHTLTNLQVLYIGSTCDLSISALSNKNVKYITFSDASRFPDLDWFPSCHTLLFNGSSGIPILISSLSVYKHSITRIAVGCIVNEDRTLLINYCKLHKISLVDALTLQREIREIAGPYDITSNE